MDWYVPETLRRFKNTSTQEKAYTLYNSFRDRGFDQVTAIRLTYTELKKEALDISQYSKADLVPSQKQEKEVLDTLAAIKLFTTPEKEQPPLGLGGIWDS